MFAFGGKGGRMEGHGLTSFYIHWTTLRIVVLLFCFVILSVPVFSPLPTTPINGCQNPSVPLLSFGERGSCWCLPCSSQSVSCFIHWSLLSRKL